MNTAHIAHSFNVFILVLTLTLTACGGNDSQTQNTSNETMLADSTSWRIAVTPTIDCLPLFLASDHGFFERAGVKVVLFPYEAQMDVDTALQRSRVDGAMTDLVRAAKLEREGLSLRRLTATDASWQLLTKRTSRISQLKQLDDKMMAMTRYSATDLLADLAVDSARVLPERIFRIQVNNIGVRLGMLQNDIMDALWLPEPQATAARNLKSRVLLDTRKLDIRLGVMVVSEKGLQGRGNELALLRKAWDEAVDSLNTNGLHAYSDLIEHHMGVSRTTVDSLATDLHFSHAADPRQKDVERVDKWWQKRLESMKYVEKRYIQ